MVTGDSLLPKVCYFRVWFCVCRREFKHSVFWLELVMVAGKVGWLHLRHREAFWIVDLAMVWIKEGGLDDGDRVNTAT